MINENPSRRPGNTPAMNSALIEMVPPVASTATVGARWTGTVGWFIAAARARSRSVTPPASWLVSVNVTLWPALAPAL